MLPNDRERGAALLTVLLLVSVIAVLAATALEKLRLSTRLAGNAAATEQARGWAQSAEVMATVKVDTLLRQSPDRTALVGGWYDRPFPLPIAGGTATARVTDGGNCFNLNGLVTEQGPGVYVANAAEQAGFARLMRLVGVPGQNADQIAAAATDWIDSDQVAQANGAEDGGYGAGQTPYRTANTLMADPSELRALLGMTPALYAQVRPWVCTLPIARPVTIDVNTLAPEQAALVAALAPGTVSVEQARAALLARPATGFANPGAFWAVPGLAGANGEAQGRTAVKSGWFALRIDVALGGEQLEEHALVDATRLPPRVVSRAWGEVP